MRQVRESREIAQLLLGRGVTKPVSPQKTFGGKTSIGQKQLHARFYVKRGRWVYEGSRLELK
jgi:hypothetical protein